MSYIYHKLSPKKHRKAKLFVKWQKKYYLIFYKYCIFALIK